MAAQDDQEVPRGDLGMGAHTGRGGNRGTAPSPRRPAHRGAPRGAGVCGTAPRKGVGQGDKAGEGTAGHRTRQRVAPQGILSQPSGLAVRGFKRSRATWSGGGTGVGTPLAVEPGGGETQQQEENRLGLQKRGAKWQGEGSPARDAREGPWHGGRGAQILQAELRPPNKHVHVLSPGTYDLP